MVSHEEKSSVIVSVLERLHLYETVEFNNQRKYEKN